MSIDCGCPPGVVCFKCEPSSTSLAKRLAAVRIGTQPHEGIIDIVVTPKSGMASLVPSSNAAADAGIRDQQLLQLWLHGRSRHTVRAYRRDAGQFFAFVGKSLSSVTLADVQAFASHLQTLKLRPGSRHRQLAAVKSLFAFGARLGYFPFDVAQPLKMPSCKDTLNERILEEDQVRRMIDAEPEPRNKLMLTVLYLAGLRVSELVALTWRDLQQRRGGGGQVTVFGKGRKTRTICIEGAAWSSLTAARASWPDTVPVFRSRRGGHLHPEQVRRIVLAAARRVGITQAVSSHWLRHCHASHALDRGAPIHLVQATLGHTSVATTSRYLHARPTESSSRYLPGL
jgi:integrase/recombinase XerD